MLGAAPCLLKADDAAVRTEIVPLALRCDGWLDPLGVDSAAPALGWKLAGDGRGWKQAAWEIVVSSSREALAKDDGDLWHSGRVAGDAQLAIRYAGRPLRSGEQVFWKVRVWDQHGVPSPWSEAARWTMGLLAPGDWTGRWISLPEAATWKRPKLGYRSEDARDPAQVKWIQIDLGSVQTLQSIRLHALRHSVPERLGFPERFKVEVAEDAGFVSPQLVADYTSGYSNPWATLIEVPGHRASGRYVRVTATGLRQREGVACLAFAQIEVLSRGKNIAVGRPVLASDSLEQGPWAASAVVDGLGVPGTNPLANATVLLRREFTVRPALKRALLFSCGLGTSELFLNGRRLEGRLLMPGWTEASRTCLYETIDVTAALAPGANVAAVELAGGMFNVQEGRYVKFVTPFRPLVARVQLRLEYADGSVATVVSDDSWRAARGPVTFANVYGGEDYDARIEPVGWKRPGFDDRGWARAAVVEGPGGALRGVSQSSPPFRGYETLAPLSVHVLRTGVLVYDFGQNASIMPRLRVRGAAGAQVKLIPAELIRPDGSVDRTSCSHGNVEASWNYTLAGAPGGEEWAPSFFYHGARYLQVELGAGRGRRLPAVEQLEAVVVHSDSPPAGDFACSNDLFNRIRLLVRWAQRSNLAHVLTDCPHRERLGWLEQYHLNGPSLRYEFDLARLYAKTFQDMEDAQLPNGLVPSIAPEYVAFEGGFRDSPEWGSAIILAAWQQFVWTGDDTVLRRHFGAMEKYLVYLKSRSDGEIVSHGLGDWYDVGPGRPGNAQLTPVALTATALYFESTRALGWIAAQIGREDAAKDCAAQADRIREAFNRKFFNNAAGTYATGSQTALALPLALDLVPSGHRSAVAEQLVRSVEESGYGVTAGDVGYRYLLRALAGAGRSDVIAALNRQSEKPGYAYQLARGCTSLAEAWDANPESSQNHFMLGQIVEWFYHDLAGLAPDPAHPGFKRTVFHPQPVPRVDWARASHETPFGRAAVSWKREATRFVLRAEVPPNTTGEVWVPCAVPQQVEESGEPAVTRPGVRLLRIESGYAVFEVGSGIYDFLAPR